jgi:DNA-directed RNA polymerase specialized sigma24 family protein
MWPDDFSDWYEWAYPPVYRAVYRYLSRRRLPHDRAADMGEEATQESARRAAERMGVPGYFASREHLRHWMIRVAQNYASDQLEKQHAAQFPRATTSPNARPRVRSSSPPCGTVLCNSLCRTSASSTGTIGTG